MIGRGIPISQSKAPLPKPIVSSSGKLHREVNSVLHTKFRPCAPAESTPSASLLVAACLFGVFTREGHFDERA
jgi:hypothetical protein